MHPNHAFFRFVSLPAIATITVFFGDKAVRGSLLYQGVVSWDYHTSYLHYWFVVLDWVIVVGLLHLLFLMVMRAVEDRWERQERDTMEHDYQ